MPVPTPTMPGAGYDELLYRGPAMAQLRILKQQMALTGLKIGQRRVEIAPGVTVFCRICFSLEEVFVTLPKTPPIAAIFDFLCHPRNSSKISMLPYYDYDYNVFTLPAVDGGGYALSGGVWSELTDHYAYPLVDNDHATFIIDVDKITVRYGNAVENYGNIWWTGTGTNPPTLSWKGPPNGFPISGVYNIPGLSRVEATIGGKQLYTCFGVYIYQSGARLCHGPQWDSGNELATLVVGACYSADAAGKKWLVAVVVTNKGAPGFFLQAWRSGDVGAHWQMIAEFAAGSRARLPAAIDPTGKYFVYDGQRYAIASDVASVAASGTPMPTAPAGSRTIVGPGGYNSNYTYASSGNCWPGMKSDGSLVYSAFTVDARFIESGDSSNTLQTKKAPVYRANPATAVNIYIDRFAEAPCSNLSGSGQIVVFRAEANGAFCTMDWSGVDCFKGDRAAKLVPDCNGNYTVSVTLQPQGVVGTYTQTVVPTNIVVSGDAGEAGTRGVTAAQYSASNTIGKVTWTNSKGMITESGYATFSGCGTATITATDSCGRTGSLQVALSSGAWIPDTSWSPCGNYCQADFCSAVNLFKIVGSYQYRYQVWNSSCAWYAALCGGFRPTPFCNDIVGITMTTDNGWIANFVPFIMSRDYWGCPT